jgi:hypothetical protein
MKDILNNRLIKIMEQLSTEDILESRKYRNWEEFDKLSEIEKLQWRLEELEIFEDIIKY